MANVLVIKSSILGDYSSSNKLIDNYVNQLQGTTSIIERDVAANPLPMLDGELAMGLRGGENLSPRQQEVNALSDQLIAEVDQSDVVVIAAPMYNFSVPVQLKAWIDLIARAGVTFRYTENGPEGLLTGKKVVLVTTRGGIHKDTPNDHVVGFMKTVLGFVGMTDVSVVYSEALAMGPDYLEKSLAEAEASLKAIAV
ncbi:FMN-dependent NADH-azoreductase [Parasalinivibrio latis]|uniref:FMN-dependent NADH-azoreductase n=1 Tax=Parasalinivibrio latis TaxID=2952610 RepID=UPI0030E181F0